MSGKVSLGGFTDVLQHLLHAPQITIINAALSPFVLGANVIKTFQDIFQFLIRIFSGLGGVFGKIIGVIVTIIMLYSLWIIGLPIIVYGLYFCVYLVVFARLIMGVGNKQQNINAILVIMAESYAVIYFIKQVPFLNDIFGSLSYIKPFLFNYFI